MSRFRFSSIVVCVMVGGVLAGCGRSGIPATHAVKGKIVFKGGDVKLLEGGTVELESVSNPEIGAIGEIEANGSFTLTTTHKDGQVASAGAIAGEHRVRVRPSNPREEHSRNLIDLRFWEFDKSGIKVTIPQNEDLVIEVHRPRR